MVVCRRRGGWFRGSFRGLPTEAAALRSGFLLKFEAGKKSLGHLGCYFVGVHHHLKHLGALGKIRRLPVHCGTINTLAWRPDQRGRRLQGGAGQLERPRLAGRRVGLHVGQRRDLPLRQYRRRPGRIAHVRHRHGKGHPGGVTAQHGQPRWLATQRHCFFGLVGLAGQ